LVLVQVVVPVSAARPPRFAGRVFALVRDPQNPSSETARYLVLHIRVAAWLFSAPLPKSRPLTASFSLAIHLKPRKKTNLIYPIFKRVLA
jgi:hypothetical protein